MASDPTVSPRWFPAAIIPSPDGKSRPQIPWVARQGQPSWEAALLQAEQAIALLGNPVLVAAVLKGTGKDKKIYTKKGTSIEEV